MKETDILTLEREGYGEKRERERERGLLTVEMARLIPVDIEIFLKLKCVFLKVLVIVGALGLEGRL